MPPLCYHFNFNRIDFGSIFALAVLPIQTFVAIVNAKPVCDTIAHGFEG
jgi:hypothetical protein